VAELVDAQASGACARKGVGVRVPPFAFVESASVTADFLLVFVRIPDALAILFTPLRPLKGVDGS
jgi:hypothetical protein